MSDLTQLLFQGSPIRYAVQPTGHWFVLRDVLEIIESSSRPANAKASIISMLGEGVVSEYPLQTAGGEQLVTIISWPALTYLVAGSRTERGRALNRFIHEEVLPQIRQTGAYLPPQGGPRPLTELDVAESVARSLRLSPTSQLRMFGKICELHNLSQAFLPPYVDEGLTRSMTALLKEHKSPVSVRTANLAMQELGLLEVLTRAGSRGQEKTFKSLTEAGLAYGRNETSPQNPRETQPLYYVAKFPELLERIHGLALV